MEIMDVGSALRTDKPDDLVADSTDEQKAIHAALTKSNHICLLSMKRTIMDHIKSSLASECTAKELMEAIAVRYKVSSNAEIGNHLQQLFEMKHDGQSGVRDYIIRLVDHQTKLRTLNVDLPDQCIVHRALNTLPPTFSIIKTQYNSQNEAWTINDLISKVDIEEGKVKKKKVRLFCMQQVPIKDFINRRKPNQDESKLTVGNNETTNVEFVGEILDSGGSIMDLPILSSYCDDHRSHKKILHALKQSVVDDIIMFEDGCVHKLVDREILILDVYNADPRRGHLI